METEIVRIPRRNAIMEFRIWFMVAEPTSVRHDTMRRAVMNQGRVAMLYDGEERPHAR